MQQEVRLTAKEAGAAAPPLRIVHLFRNPVGGLFRHVRDLAVAQAAAGHRVGIICDSLTGGAYEQRLFEELAPVLALGLRRMPMRRQITPGDIGAALRVLGALRRLRPDVIHGHGAKGGAYARLGGTFLRASGVRVARLYTPHGGSLHYGPALKHRAYFLFERLLGRLTDAFLFVSRYEADAYRRKVGAPGAPGLIVPNGLRPAEFEPVMPAADARDFLYVGMLRDLKGPDLFIEALALLGNRLGRSPSAHIVGDGEDGPRYRALADRLGLSASVSFHPPMPARAAFAMARNLVVPSRAESMPYIVLEAAAAGMPMTATRVGGIPEIFGRHAGRLVAPGDPAALAEAMAAMLMAPEAARADAAALRETVRPVFSIEAMTAAVEAAYRQVL